EAQTLGPEALGLLGALVFFAGVVDALAGGGGLITLPAYLAAGLPPALLLGTNKLASSIGTLASAARYGRQLRIPVVPFLPVVAAAFAGSWAGARLTLLLDPAWLRPLLLAALPLVGAAVYGHQDRVEGRGHRPGDPEATPASLAVGAGVAAYDGFFGPGTGTFFALGLARFCGHDLLGATARAKVLNLSSNLAALAAFLVAGRVHLELGISMGAVSILGHTVGAHLGLRRGAAAIRPAIVAVCAGLFAKLAFDSWR
ncbi:MAG: TSUP family transporter, partial [Elusimicrobia bacterium]|nr:TSUP family transporter [Elusimicrobiota bacterium]